MSIQVKSFQQLVGQMVRRLIAVTGINDINKGSVLLTLAEAAAQNDYEQMASMIQLLDDFSVDNATGADLDKRAVDYGLLQGRKSSSFASGYVDLSDSTVIKISTAIYVGANPPLAGDTIIKVNSTTGFNNGDQVYIGRGTPNLEGPIQVANVSAGVAFGTLTLSNPLTNNHNGNETIIKAQAGNRSIPRGTKVRIPANNVSDAVLFTTQEDATVADGESVVQNILVRADKPGTSGNAALKSITEFASSPFSGASVANTTAFSNANDAESDDDLRARIKSNIQALSKGVAQAIISGVVGASDDEDNKRVVSASLIEPVSSDDVATLYIDDGTGFEPSFNGNGSETIINSAAGTEQYLQVGNFPIVKAQVVTTNSQPYDFSVGGTLTVKVNGKSETIDLDPTDFSIPDNATAVEIASAINNKAATFSARTADGQTKVVIFSNGSEDNSIQIPNNDENVLVNSILGFPTEEVLTIKLYKNNILLSHDGVTALTQTADFDTWSGITDPSVLAVDVNNRPRQWIRVGTDSLEVAYGQGSAPGSYTSIPGTAFLDLGVSIQTASLAQWVTVLNQLINGAVFSADQDVLVLTSLLENTPNSYLQVLPVASAPSANLASIQGWDTTAKAGKNSDFTFNRFSGQIKLASPLSAGDKLEAGTTNTRGFKNSSLANTDYDLSTVASRPAAIYVVVDGTVTHRQASITPSVTTLTASRPGGTTTIRYTANGSVFGTALNPLVVGDYVVVARSEATLHEGIFRITNMENANASSSWFEVMNPAVTVNPAGTATSLQSIQDVQIFASTVPPQKVTLANSNHTSVASVVNQINQQVTGATAINQSTYVQLITDKYASGGSLQVPASVEWVGSRTLGFDSTVEANVVPHVAALESNSELGYPIALGKGSVTTSDTDGVAPVVVTDSARTGASPGSNNQWLRWLSGNNKGLRLFTQSYSAGTPTVITCRDSSYVATGSTRLVAPEILRGTGIGDLYAQLAPFEFDQGDTVVVVIDGDTLAKTYTIPLYRSGRCTSAGASSVSGSDLDGAAGTDFTGSFWSTYDFTDYKLWFRAHQVYNPTGTKNAFILRSLKYGPTGNRIRFGLAYPTAPALALASSVQPKIATTDITVSLGSGAARAIASDATTQFNITTGAGTTVYTYNGTGTAPNFVANGVVVGDIATFNSLNFSAGNNITGYVSAVSPTAVTLLSTSGIVESNKALGISSALKIYPLASNAASAVIGLINSDSVISRLAEAVKTDQDPFGTANDASGLITRSSTDDPNVTAQYVTLVDGENFVSAYQNPGTPSFTLKANLTEQTVSDGGTIYDFGTAINKDGTNGEYFRLIPTTARQLVDHLNKKGITSLSLNASVQRSGQGDKVQISSLTVGSTGSVNVTGGSGNASSLLITKTGTLDGTGVKNTALASETLGFYSGATVKVANAFLGKNLNTYDVNTTVALTIPGVYNSTVAKVELAERASFNLTGNTISVTANVDGTATYTRATGGSDFTTAKPGDEVYIDSSLGFNAANRGQFPVVSSTTTTLIVVNPYAVNDGATAVPANKMIAKIPFFYHPQSPVVGVIMVVEKLNDRFSRYRYVSGGAKAPLFAKNGVLPDFFVDVSSPFSANNTGRFRVVAVDDTSFIVENKNALEEQVTCVSEIVDGTTGESTGGSLRFWGPNSAITSGTLNVDALNVANWWIAGNSGKFAIRGQGRNLSAGADPGRHFIYVQVGNATVPQTVGLSTNVTSFYTLEPSAFTSYRQVENVCVNPINANESYIWISNNLNSDRFNSNYGTSISAVNKLGFSTTAQVGVDGYSYWTGLLRHVHRIVDGFDQDPVNFPGIKAAGTQIEVIPPIIQRVKLTVEVKTINGLSTNALSDTIKSTILAYITSLGIGDDVILSEVIKRVQEIPGIQSVIMINPTANTERVVIQDNEKAISFESDITVV
jgi:hypothetical protein